MLRLPGYKPGVMCHWKAPAQPNHLTRQIFMYCTVRETTAEQGCQMPRANASCALLVAGGWHLPRWDTATFSLNFLTIPLAFHSSQMTNAAFTWQIQSINSEPDPAPNGGMGFPSLTKQAAYHWPTALYGRRGSFLPTFKYRFHFHMCINDRILLCISCCWTYFKDDRKPLCISSC